MLPFSLIENPRAPEVFPVFPYSVGRHIQYHHVRPGGFPVHQVFMIRSGSGLFRDMENGTETELLPGMAFAFPGDRGHEYYPLSHEPWHIAFIGFYGAAADGFLQGGGTLPSVPFRPLDFELCWESIGSIWHTVHQQASARQDDHIMLELSVALYRLLLLLRRPEAPPAGPGRLEFQAVRNEALQKAVRLINEHFTEPLLISNLAGAVGYSVQHFQRLFLQEYGVTPHKYLQNLRLQRALQMITENDQVSVQDIALQLGMETNYFIRVFRSTYGCTPGVMLKRLHGSQAKQL
ncbi:AraC family transcriptional regulator [Paenibacillus donghaensis]|uniref:AraC family transcriptional regulator n=1 Tax=Paenibacillus donghaensis TaxID=414771 RepID=A0A2Z2KG50_9BACL|nr:AraC family transcriptional regulator [Paenibacillus donghaensis]ASA22173.1 AraC family transcriptional regulator [Paenibacillus donghaensis]